MSEDKQLACVESSSQEIAVRVRATEIATRADIEQLRLEREAHRHSTIWTKDPHGGAYRKATKSGYDPLIQNPDGTKKELELGFQHVEVGPTSNFVGNHMTQGAIDLVQAELQKDKKSQKNGKTSLPICLVDEGHLDLCLTAPSTNGLQLLEPKQPPDLTALRAQLRQRRKKEA